MLQHAQVTLRAPVSESLSRLQRDQLQKFAQYLISELPQQVPAAGDTCSQHVLVLKFPSEYSESLYCFHLH